MTTLLFTLAMIVGIGLTLAAAAFVGLWIVNRVLDGIDPW